MNLGKLVIVSTLFFSIYSFSAPTFSIHNKSKDAIFVDLTNGASFGSFKNYFLRDNKVEPNAFLDSEININDETKIIIHNGTRNGAKELSRATFSKGKTIYINWDGIRIYPQRGPLMGLSGKTDKGYSTKNNVKAQDIK